MKSTLGVVLLCILLKCMSEIDAKKEKDEVSKLAKGVKVLESFVHQQTFTEVEDAKAFAEKMAAEIHQQPAVLHEPEKNGMKEIEVAKDDAKQVASVIASMKQESCPVEVAKHLHNNGNISRRRKRHSGDEKDNYLIVGLKKVGHGYKVVINTFAIVPGILSGLVGLVLSPFIACFVSVSQCFCLEEGEKLTPFKYILIKTVAYGVKYGYFVGAYMFSIPLTLGTAHKDYKNRKHKLDDELSGL